MHSQLKFLYSLKRLGIKTGLEHTLSLLNHVNNPHKNFPSIHVAGTNGKGSTCLMISSILKDMNLKLITQFHVEHSPANIEKMAKENLGMIKKRPKEIINEKEK